MENKKDVGFKAPACPPNCSPSDVPSPKVNSPAGGAKHGGTVDTSPRPHVQGGMAQGSKGKTNPSLD